MRLFPTRMLAIVLERSKTGAMLRAFARWGAGTRAFSDCPRRDLGVEGEGGCDKPVSGGCGVTEARRAERRWPRGVASIFETVFPLFGSCCSGTKDRRKRNNLELEAATGALVVEYIRFGADEIDGRSRLAGPAVVCSVLLLSGSEGKHGLYSPVLPAFPRISTRPQDRQQSQAFLAYSF